MLKKIFYGSLYLVLQTMILSYMTINPMVDGTRIGTLIGLTDFTGVPVIGVIMIFPAFVFTIISLTMEKKAVNFCRDLFSMFVGLFITASSIVGIFKMFDALYIPIIVAICSVTLLIISLVNVATALKKDAKAE